MTSSGEPARNAAVSPAMPAPRTRTFILRLVNATPAGQGPLAVAGAPPSGSSFASQARLVKDRSPSPGRRRVVGHAAALLALRLFVTTDARARMNAGWSFRPSAAT